MLYSLTVLVPALRLTLMVLGTAVYQSTPVTVRPPGWVSCM